MDEFIKNITKKAGRAVLKKFGKAGVKYTKEDISDVVTEADLISNKIIIDAIKRKYPRHGIISEETGVFQPDSKYTWLIDPVDGTRNFATRTPLFGIMVALAKNKKIELASIFNPATDEFYFAKRGRGSFRNGKRIHCSKAISLKHSFGCSTADWNKQGITLIGTILKTAQKNPLWINCFGSIAVNSYYVADGRRDWCATGGNIWDFGAPSLILAEAGCTVTNLKGQPWQFSDTMLIAANPALHPKVLAMMQGIIT